VKTPEQVSSDFHSSNRLIQSSTPAKRYVERKSSIKESLFPVSESGTVSLKFLLTPIIYLHDKNTKIMRIKVDQFKGGRSVLSLSHQWIRAYPDIAFGRRRRASLAALAFDSGLLLFVPRDWFFLWWKDLVKASMKVFCHL